MNSNQLPAEPMIESQYPLNLIDVLDFTLVFFGKKMCDYFLAVALKPID
jgi:hypothetical protein